jgi:hypothetical protein
MMNDDVEPRSRNIDILSVRPVGFKTRCATADNMSAGRTGYKPMFRHSSFGFCHSEYDHEHEQEQENLS